VFVFLCGFYTILVRGDGMSMGERIRLARDEIGMSQVELAEAVGVDSNTISRWERNLNRVTSDYVRKLAKALNKTIPYLYEENEKEYEFNQISNKIMKEAGATVILQTDLDAPYILGKYAKGIERDDEIFHSMTPDEGMNAQPDDPAPMPNLEALNNDPQVEVLKDIAGDPRKFAAAALLSGMDENQLRKAFEYLSDQKQLAEYQRLKEAQ
jgi:transcriptional regulator with XRE-family HTH domain